MVHDPGDVEVLYELLDGAGVPAEVVFHVLAPRLEVALACPDGSDDFS